MSVALIPFEGLKAKGVTLGRCQVWRLEKAGKFPKHINISTNRTAWIESEVDEWIAARIAARDRG
jgi:prophage regulatory protein